MRPHDLKVAICPLLNGPQGSENSFADQFLGRMLDATQSDAATSCGTSGEEAVQAMDKLTTIEGTIAALGTERMAVDSMNALLFNNLAEFEADLGQMLLERDCPGVAFSQTAAARHICLDFEQRSATALRDRRETTPFLGTKISAIKERISSIDAGSSQECHLGSAVARPLAGSRGTAMKQAVGKLTSEKSGVDQMAWCGKVDPLVGALMEGQNGQKRWTSEMLADMQNITMIGLEVNRQMHNLVAHKRDGEFPKESIDELKKVLDQVDPPLKQMKTIGENREREAAKVGKAALEVLGTLEGLRKKHGCTALNVLPDCSSFKATLTQELQFHSEELQRLQASYDKEIRESDEGAVTHDCLRSM